MRHYSKVRTFSDASLQRGAPEASRLAHLLSPSQTPNMFEALVITEQIAEVIKLSYDCNVFISSGCMGLLLIAQPHRNPRGPAITGLS